MAARQPEGPPPPPIVQRVRLRYAKRGRLRFTSHRDVARVVERAVRRAELPIAFSAGFSPHPKISWLGAAPTGVASEAEYVELALSARVEPGDVARRLDAALPPGIDVLDAVEAGPGSFADRMEGSDWWLRLSGVDPVSLDLAVAAFLAADSVVVTRRMKDGNRELDARAAVLRLSVHERPPAALAAGMPGDMGVPAPSVSTTGVLDAPCAILRVVVRHTTPVVRPDDVMAALRAVAPLELGSPPVATRLAQGPLQGVGQDGADVSVSDPLAPDRAAGEQVDTADVTA